MTEDQEKNVEKWVEALRSGKYQQGKGALCRDGKFCCLGVACEVLGISKRTPECRPTVYYEGESTALPKKVAAMLGLRTCTGDFGREGGLIDLNDDVGASFNDIANVIESRPEGLFVT
jgi:hypothetical protein